KLPQVLTPLREAIELNREGSTDHLDLRSGAVRGARGLRRHAGLQHACTGTVSREGPRHRRPFLGAVVEAATRNQCFIDKTIGDEVMFVMPSIGEDVVLANISLEVTDP